MPMHDWRRVEAGIFHDFHHAWIYTLKHTLNQGLLPPDLYALAEQIAGGYGPDVLTLEGNGNEDVDVDAPATDSGGGIALATAKPKTWFHEQTEADIYAAKANRIAVRHVSDHRVIAVIEIVSPGNKSSVGAMRRFTAKAAELVEQGIHLLVIDPFAPTPRDREGIHQLIWGEMAETRFVLPAERQLTLVSYRAVWRKEAFIEPIAVGMALPDMPLFISEDRYVLVPLERTYQSAWDAVPPIWRRALQ